MCQGLSWVCRRPVPLHAPWLRYLRADHSGMGLRLFTATPYLVYLSLAFCAITDVQLNTELPNLQSLDLNTNRISNFIKSGYNIRTTSKMKTT